MIEAFDEVVKDEVMVDELKTWLLKQKQTQNWPTTKGATEACYALLVTGDDWLAQSELVRVVDKQIISCNNGCNHRTGYWIL